MTEKRKGNQNPTTSVILPFTETEAQGAVDLYEKSGRTAQEWQRKLLEAILATNDEGLWVHTKFGYSLPRRNGKNEIAAMRELYGLLHGEQVLHTAHRTTTSHAAWERLLKLLDKAGMEYRSLRAIGRERVEMSDTEGRVEFRTRTSTGGLGEGYDLLVIDEAQEYTTDQESALKYVVTDSRNPQTILCGTPSTPLSSGTVFVGFRKEVLDGGRANSGWAEWGVEEETDPRDVEAWYKTNPSLGTIFTERSIQDEIGDKIDFNIQRLGLWIKYNQKSAITALEWGALKLSDMPVLKEPLNVGIKYGKDGRNVALSIATKTLSGHILVEAVDCRPARVGPSWITDFLKSADVAHVVIDGANGQKLLADEMVREKLKPPLLPSVWDVINANAMFRQNLYQQRIRHFDQPSLTQVVTNCKERPIGSHGGKGYDAMYEDMDIALMDSVILAQWACSIESPKQKQRIRY